MRGHVRDLLAPRGGLVGQSTGAIKGSPGSATPGPTGPRTNPGSRLSGPGGALTENPTAEGETYLCAVKDVFSSRIMGC